MLAAYMLSQHHSPSEIQTCYGVVMHTRQEETARSFCPALPAKVPFQNQRAAALLGLVVTTTYKPRAFGRRRPSRLHVCTHFCLLVPFLPDLAEWK